MSTVLKTALVLTGLALGASACGSDPAEELVGEWAGQCTTAADQDGSQETFDATLEFGPDGRYLQKLAVPGIGEMKGSFTATDDSINVQGDDGAFVDATYSVNDDTLTVTTTDSSVDGAEGSTCTLTRS